MVMTDPIADMFTRIRNANKSRHDYAKIPLSKLKEQVAFILKKEGFVQDVKVVDAKDGFKHLSLLLKYDDELAPIITGIQRVSKPGLRVYVGYKDIPLVKGGLGISIVSTSSGVMSGRSARKRNLGGEVLGIVW